MENALHALPLDARSFDDAFARSVLDGLSATPKVLEPKWFYDERGSSLFDGITRTEAYYQTRTELAILTRHAAEIAAAIGSGTVLFEPGAGSMVKARVLLAALDTPTRYVPTDISGVHLHAAATLLRGELPGIDIRPRVLEFDAPLSADSGDVAHAPVTVFFPGSTIGNLEPTAAGRLLERFATETGARYLLIGVDTPPGERKSLERLVEAYADPEGITAAFNRNLLVRINRELGGDFDPALFAHVARYDSVRERIEMHLESTVRQSVCVLQHRFDFEPGETIMTETSYKHTAAGFERLAAGAGWSPVTHWSDDDGFFSVYLFER